MFIDARTLDDGSVLEADLVIVGAGAAGITIAHRLAGTRAQVLLVESGGLEFGTETQSLHEGRNVGLPYFDLDTCRLRFFGGSTNHWAGRCRPLDPIDFEERDWIPLSGWPITREALAPFYRDARELCELGPFGFRPEEAGIEADRLLPLDPARFTSKLWQFSPPTNFGDAYRGSLEKAGNLNVALHANLVEIVLEPGLARVERLRLQTLDGRRLAALGRVVVLACGGLENARLLLASNRQIPAGVGNEQDVVGRCFMEHPHIVASRLVTDAPERAAFYDYAALDFLAGEVAVLGCLSVSPAMQRERRLVNYDSSLYVDTVGAGGYAALRRMWNAAERGEMPADLAGDIRQALFDLGDTVRGLLGRFDVLDYAQGGAYRVWSYLEQTPNPDSRVTLADERDAIGLPRIRLDWRLTEIERRSLRTTLELFAEEVGRSGVGRLQIEEWLTQDDGGWSPELIGGHHHMGTTRMAADARHGVVDASCRVHGIDNLFIAGSSVFPTSGAANPTLTIVAMALRLADELSDRLAA